MTDLGLRTGGCLCGAVRYAVTDLPRHVHACHCGNCRKISSAAMLSVAVPNTAMQISGVEHVTVYTSSPWATRSFCRNCGAGLWYRLTEPDAATAGYFISAGTLDDARGMVLAKEIYVDCKQAGYAFAGDHPKLTEAEFMASLHAKPEE
jgi:hypothetical protein